MYLIGRLTSYHRMIAHCIASADWLHARGQTGATLLAVLEIYNFPNSQHD